jgi:hypothetical protein
MYLNFIDTAIKVFDITIGNIIDNDTVRIKKIILAKFPSKDTNFGNRYKIIKCNKNIGKEYIPITDKILIDFNFINKINIELFIAINDKYPINVLATENCAKSIIE